jgi:hypothetical protein
MCDTFILSNPSSGEKKRYFAKNSDREISEMQIPVYISKNGSSSDEGLILEYSEKYQKGTKLLTKKYLFDSSEIKQKYSVILSKPVWMWGGEIGVNEKGLAIGNEAVYSKLTSPEPAEGLLAMDVLRAALECCGTAEEALEFLIRLTEKHSMSADGGYKNIYCYDSSFLIMDVKKGYVFETAGKEWASKEIDANWFISNAYSIETEYDRISGNNKNVNFKTEFEDRERALEKAGDYRRERGLAKLNARPADNALVKEVLRSHLNDSEEIKPGCRAICRHPAEENEICTTASMYVEYMGDSFILWIANSPFPCMSVYLPYAFNVDNSVNDIFLDTEKIIDKNRMYREVFGELTKNKNIHSKYIIERDLLEKRFEKKIDSTGLNKFKMKTAFHECYSEETDFLNKWRNKLFKQKLK